MDHLPSLKIIEICKVAPPPLEPSHAAAVPSTLPLTYLDLFWLRFHPIQRLFFYELPSNDISFIDEIVPKLKTSLSLILRHYLLLAGNLVWLLHSDFPTIESVDGDSVSLIVAESGADFYQLSGNGFHEVYEFHPLVPQLPVSHDRAAIFAIQVTTFQNKGFSIGITNHHAVIDGRISTSFIKSWAQICMDQSSVPIANLTPFYDRSVINDPKGLAKIYASAWLNQDGPNNRSLNLKLPKPKPSLVRSTFEFTHQNLEKLKQWGLKKNGEQMSSFVVATAYLCVCTAKLDGLRDGNLLFGFAADATSRLKPPVPLNYFGNCLIGGMVSIERVGLLGENGIALACEQIIKGVKSLEGGAFEGAENFGTIMSELTNDYSKAQGISLAGSHRFGVYNVDFGWGKPVKVEIVSAESPLVFSLSDSRNSDVGMEIGVVKERDQMETFAALFNEGFEAL
ncbi:malonyl-CoA:anthocyanidin 5-O-glucoside-6''-O-malonyltransferase-like [Cucurbita moschata]|uniref:Malonyl-CoA:anthocyanidin 5-O-glucoside-6''-O-malonyltransferase-like n=1 Tax=Cucurbita moschata TaxID=3662 RepID=A0A6J1HPT4_CUCMO|nr:malonyl-CoA:anthocyanidin 5-O-glucoside-6''-O-malonyltransferase-like [Cucurbita moschata]